jgi:hypothetical protein
MRFKISSPLKKLHQTSSDGMPLSLILPRAGALVLTISSTAPRPDDTRKLSLLFSCRDRVGTQPVFPVGLVLKEGYERKRECEKFKDYAKRLIKAQQLERYYVGEAFSRALHM